MGGVCGDGGGAQFARHTCKLVYFVFCVAYGMYGNGRQLSECQILVVYMYV